jgi:hypothetical protein
MVLLRVFGLLDLFCAITTTLFFLGSLSVKFPILTVLYLGFKAFLFKGDFASFLDGLTAFFVILMMLGFKNILILLFVVIYLGQKGIASLVS